MWTLLITIYSSHGVVCTAVPGFTSREAAEAAQQAHAATPGIHIPVRYTVVYMGDPA